MGRRVGAATQFKRHLRKLRKSGQLGKLQPLLDQVIRVSSGEWYVLRGGQRVAGPFDTKDEAETWTHEIQR